jgi:hypothetical protein
VLPDNVSSYPATPRDIADWEDLLVRLEIMPRALRNALEEVNPSDAELPEILSELLVRERWVAEALPALREGGAAPVFPNASDVVEAHAESADPVRSMYYEVSSLRAKNFAQLQRRGFDVWAWTARRAEGGEMTAYQLLRYLVDRDAGFLASLRRPAGERGTAC